MKMILGIVLILLGILAGAYVGVWLCFIGGIVQIIEQIRADTLVPLQVAIGVAKVFFTGLAFWLTAMFFIAPGSALLKS